MPDPAIKRSAILAFALASACSVDIKQFEPPVDVPHRFSLSGEAVLADRWWLVFGDRELNRLIDIALAGNLDLGAAFDRLDQARAFARKAGSELIPEINGSAEASRIYDNPPATGTVVTDNFSMGLVASYELDLWGRIRAGKYAAERDAKAAEQDIRAAAITLTAEIASKWYQLVAQHRQLDLLNDQIEANRQTVELVSARFKGGQATAADLFQQSQILEAAVGDRYSVLSNIEVLKNQLSILTGRAPGAVSLDENADFPEIPPLPDTGLSADLIRRRPDIKSAFYRLQSADLRIAAAVADRFPRLSLSASIDTSAPDLQDFFNNWMATLAGNLLIPLVDGGRRVAEVDRNRAIAAEALNLYGQSVLQSLQEVENALAQEARQHERLESLEKQLRYLDDANTQIRLRYIYGAMDFLRVITSIISLQNLQRSLISAQQQLIDYRINLYRSLAGGWPLHRPVPERNRSHG
ncbi:MAG: efflux transporter outer membrane subunit [Gammaproteobacteria bacterium]